MLVTSCTGIVSGGVSIVGEAPTRWVCFTDASWVDSWDTGTGFFLQEGEQLLAYGIHYTSSSCPLQAEAKALATAMAFVQQRGLHVCTFCTDNLVLAKEVSKVQPPTTVDWRAANEFFLIWEFLQKNRGWNCIYISRSHNEMADRLAGLGRREKMDLVGFTCPILNSIC